MVLRACSTQCSLSWLIKRSVSKTGELSGESCWKGKLLVVAAFLSTRVTRTTDDPLPPLVHINLQPRAGESLSDSSGGKRTPCYSTRTDWHDDLEAWLDCRTSTVHTPTGTINGIFFFFFLLIAYQWKSRNQRIKHTAAIRWKVHDVGTARSLKWHFLFVFTLR